MRSTTPFGGSRKRAQAALITLVAALAVSLGGADHAFSAPPVNDNFGAATEIGPNLPVSIGGTTDDSSVETGEPEPLAELAGSVWYRWTAPAGFNRTLRISLCRTSGLFSGFFGINALYGGDSLEELEPRTYSYGTCGELFFLAEPETTYHLQVGNEAGYPGERDSFTLQASVVDGPANDRMVDAPEISGPLPWTINATNRNASVDSVDEFEFFDFGHTVWYRINVIESGVLRLDACSDKILPSAHVFDPEDPDFQSRFEPVEHDHLGFELNECFLVPSDHTEQWVEAGREYLIGVDTWDIPLINSHGPFTLKLSGSAKLAPGLANSIRIRKVKVIPKQRKAKLKVEVPGPGTVEVLASKKVKGDRRHVGRARVVTLEAVAKGTLLTALRRKGARKAAVRVRFTPDGPGGRANTISRNIKFRLK